MFAHANDGLDPFFASMNVPFGKYRHFMTQAQTEESSSCSLLHVFVNIVVLKSVIFLKPIPPTSFDNVSRLHVTQCIGIIFSRPFHQNCIISFAISLHHVFQSQNKVITYVSIAVIIAFISVSLPALLRKKVSYS